MTKETLTCIYLSAKFSDTLVPLVSYDLFVDLCSAYLRKETAVVSIVLPFVYHGLAHYAVFLRNSHGKKGINS